MAQRNLGISVFDAALERLIEVYQAGHRVIVSFSAGKDSTVSLELAIMAAGFAGRLPVEVVMRDEEIMLPGTYEFAERTAARPDVDFHWMIANQPIVNAFNRKQPYFWVFDPTIEPDQWVRQPPSYSYTIPHLNIEKITTPDKFPPPEGKNLVIVLGLRAQESINRKRGLFSSGGHLTAMGPHGFRKCRPIYDWTEADVWKAIADNKWDYNEAYDIMARMGVKRSELRTAPPTMSGAGIEQLGISSRAFPKWFDRVCKRLDGVRTAAQFGRRAVEPQRRQGESWEQCFARVCVEQAPAWIADRAVIVSREVVRKHERHSMTEFPDAVPCVKCGAVSTWKNLCKIMYMGDPFSLKQTYVPYVEPEFFRAGSGFWGGKPTF